MIRSPFLAMLFFFGLPLLLAAQETEWTFRPVASPWEIPTSEAAEPSGSILEIASSRGNKITDTDEWFERVGVRLPVVELDEVPGKIPRRLNGAPLQRVIDQGENGYLLFYGDHLLAAATDQGDFRYGFDFREFLQPPVETEPYTDQYLVWAVESNGVLYLSNSHRTYAKASAGKNGYLTAVRIEDGELLWRSAPLLANARNFLVNDDFLISGYGFTSEPDYLYIIDRQSGRTLQQLKVKTGPSYLLFDDSGRLQVRTYNTDYEVKVGQVKSD